MEDHWTVVRARCLAVWHIIVGIFLVCLGIIEQSLAGTIYMYMGIWTGIWVSRNGSSSHADFVFVLKEAKTCRRHYKEIKGQFHSHSGFSNLVP